MLPEPAYVISDLHLGAAPPAVEKGFLAFLRSIPDSGGSLLINGDLFNHVIGFSPALLFAPERRGTPDVFISHGTNDPVISVTNSRDNLVPALRQAGYLVEYVEFDGEKASETTNAILKFCEEFEMSVWIQSRPLGSTQRPSGEPKTGWSAGTVGS